MLGRVNILDICVLTSSDVTINEMEIKIATFFRKIERNQYCDFWSTCDSIPTPYHPRGTGDQHRRSQNGFKPPPLRESGHAECGGVYIHDSEYWNIKIKIESPSTLHKNKSKSNREEISQSSHHLQSYGP